MKFRFALCVSAMAAIMGGGCAHPTKTSPEEERIARLLRDCMHQDGLKFIRSQCVTSLKRESPEVKAKAQKIFDDKLAILGPDFKLLNSIWEKNATDVKRALSLGANVNREFTTVDIYGSSFDESATNTTTPAFEARDPKTFEALVMAGANLHWIQPYQKQSIIARRFHETSPADGLVLSEIALKLGYHPSAEDLAYFKQYAEERKNPLDKRKYQNFYNKVIATSSKTESARAAVIEAENKASRIREEKELTERAEGIKVQTHAHAAIAEEFLNSQMRAVGVVGQKVCTITAMGDAYIGNVVAVSDQKIGVYITSAFPSGRPDLVVPGFRPHTTWESVNYWKACN